MEEKIDRCPHCEHLLDDEEYKTQFCEACGYDIETDSFPDEEE